MWHIWLEVVQYYRKEETLNPLTTDDTFWRRQILATCYQLAKSVLKKIGSALAERVGQVDVGGYTALPDSAWWQLQLCVEKPWSRMGGPFVLHKQA